MSKLTPKQLCEKLIAADSETDVIRLLESEGYWNDSTAWRLYGDEENNWGIIGAQQASPDAALVEKLTNSGDAVLMRECRAKGIDPTSSSAPQSIDAAIRLFFKNDATPKSAGRLIEWTATELTRIAERITIAATGNKPDSGHMCLTIADDGEGQTPSAMPKTLLSLAKSNKDKIRFVQGRFNMGGTGVLRFGGKHRLQLIVSRRDPSLLPIDASSSDRRWGFTIVRREAAGQGEQNSKFRYLAPSHMGSDNEVLEFDAASMPIFPAHGDQADPRPNPYGRASDHGTLIKLYEYQLTGNRSNIVGSRKGLRQRLDMLLAGAALPARVYECRSYGGKVGSFISNIGGLLHKLNLERQDNLEPGFPLNQEVTILGEHFSVDIYAFKPDKYKSYKENEGVIFVLNGQVHATLAKTFFTQKNVGLSYLKDDILVVVDLSRLTSTAREDLVMTSRDRLSKGAMSQRLEEEVTLLLKDSRQLAELQAERRKSDIANKLADEKPLENLLKQVFRRNPELAKVFDMGARLHNPFDVRPTKSAAEFKGVATPTYFRFRGKAQGHTLTRNVELDRRFRIDFETDAENAFFSTERGTQITVYGALDGKPLRVDFSSAPDNGIVHVSGRLPESAKAGQLLALTFDLTSPELLDPFSNEAAITIVEKSDPSTTSPKSNHKPPSKEAGSDQPNLGGITLPKTILRRRDDWETREPKFDQFSALAVMSVSEDDRITYDYHVNLDNIHLLTELKLRPSDTSLTSKRFELALVLVGMGLISELTSKRNEKPQEDDDDSEPMDMEDFIRKATSAIAPIVLPMISALATLDVTEDPGLGEQGDEDSEVEFNLV